ncbi:MAG: glycosyltransferase family 39 protein [Spirochaetales bacterium]|nr:glycosyltransferase family 39 protein [Spirochaetales bacterium]
MKNKISHILLICGTVIFLGGGQTFFMTDKNAFPGILFYSIGIILLVVLFMFGNKESQAIKIKTDRKAVDLKRIISFTFSILFFLVVCVFAYMEKAGIFVVMLWILSMVLFLLSFRDNWSIAFKIDWEFLKKHKIDIFLLSLLILFGIVTRFLFLDSIPWGLNQEESFAGMGARDILDGTSTDLLGFGPNSAQGFTFYSNFYFLIQALFTGLFGPGPFGMRFFSALSGVVLIIAVFFLVKEILNKTTAYIAAFLVASSDILVHFSRFGFPFIHDSVFCVLTLFFIYRAVKTNSLPYFAATGIVVGLSQYFWASSRINIALVLGFLILKILLDRNFLKINRIGILVMIGGFILCFLPLVMPPTNRLINFTEGADRNFIFGGTYAEFTQIKGDASIFKYLLDQMYKSFFAFNLIPDNGYLWHAPWPYLGFVTGIFFVIGLAHTLKKWREDYALLLLTIFFGGVFALVALTVGAPNYQRLSAIFAIPFIFAAIGVKTCHELGKKLITEKVTWAAIAVLLFGYIGTTGMIRYFLDYSGKHYFQNYREPVNYIGYYIKKKGPGYHYVIPNPYRHFKWTVDFLLVKPQDYDIDYVFMSKPGEKAFYFAKDSVDKIRGMNLSRGTVLLLLNIKTQYLEELLKAYPNAEEEKVLTDFEFSIDALILK